MNSIQLKVLNRLSYELNSAKGAKQTLMNSIQLKVLLNADPVKVALSSFFTLNEMHKLKIWLRNIAEKIQFTTDMSVPL